MNNGLNLFVLLATLLSSGNVLADAEFADRSKYTSSTSTVSVVDNDLYKSECGSCHEAYSAGLLPPQSWELIIASLDQHFGESISLDRNSKIEIFKYLLNAAAGRSEYILSSRLIEGSGAKVYERITMLPFFVDKHQKVDGSLSDCRSCHTQSLSGSFAVQEIKMP